MKIIDVISDSALFLGLTQEAEILKTVTEETEMQVLQEHENIAKLFNLIKYSIRELCTNYLPIIEKRKIKTKDKQYPISSLENFIRINHIYKDEQFARFKILNRNITMEEDGEYVINYSMYPTIISMMEDINFLENFSPDVIVFGLCAYFSLAHGMFDEFEEFHNKYVAKAESLKSVRCFELSCRRWEWEIRKLLKLIDLTILP